MGTRFAIGALALCVGVVVGMHCSQRTLRLAREYNHQAEATLAESMEAALWAEAFYQQCEKEVVSALVVCTGDSL